jgi:hypothetical protein
VAMYLSNTVWQTSIILPKHALDVSLGSN